MTTTPTNPFASITSASTGDNGSEVSGTNDYEGGGNAGQLKGQGTVKVNRFSRLAFTGTARQLFGIHFVNILLSLVTLGVWIPWARVRNRRFFYGNTRVLDNGIDYLATGFALFKGWVLVLFAFLIFYITPYFAEGLPYIQEGLSIIFMFIYPWALTKSIYFNARNLAWRDVRFDWQGGYFGAAWYFFLFPIISILSLGLLIPLMSCKARQYIVNNYRFGQASFDARLEIGSFYGAAIQTIFAFIFMLIIVSIISVGLVFVALGNQMTFSIFDNFILLTTLETPQVVKYALYFIPVLFLAIFYATGAFYHASTRNIMVNALHLHGGVKFRSELSGSKLAWIMISNSLAIILSFGLLWPWAQVRRYRYLVESTQLRPSDNIDSFVDSQSRAGHSIGDAASDAGGIELQF
ncbi:YjgN family protein [Candidatus Puniceispirillum sp.]|uniref:YjgN family protein n=1 Tax=Candidatus Puniceispirillum sp. TaxID=2026719 RepID=UPI003F69604A